MGDTTKKILIVEDEIDMREALVDELTRSGFATLIAKNGKEGLASALRDRPDLILLDIIMPEMDGMAMMKQLRTDAWGKTVPIIILTNASANDKILQGVVADEPSYYLVKSDWNLADVVGRIKEVLDKT